MKITSTIARYLLGIIFTVFGLNGFLQFIPQPPIPAGPMADFMSATVPTHYLAFVFAVQLVCGLLFLANRYVALALTLIAPVLVNILLFHITIQPSGLPPGIVATVLWFLTVAPLWRVYKPLFQATN